MHLGNEMLQHFFSDHKIRDHAVLQWADSSDIAWRTAQHTLGLHAHRFDRFLSIVNTNGNHRGLVQDDALVTDINQRVRSTEIDGQVVGKCSAKLFEHEFLLPCGCHGEPRD